MAKAYRISYAEARKRKKTNPEARWPNIATEFAGDVWPRLEPGFRLEADEAVFTIGSCFARNIERHLVSLGRRVPMMDFRLPAEEWSGEPNGAMNKFHPPAFRQCLEWTARIHDRDGQVGWSDCEALAFDCGEGLYFDVDMGAAGQVTRERFIERRQHVYDIFSQVFSAGCLMMTPGLIEAWRDKQTGLYIHEAPNQKAMAAVRERWELEILDYETCLADMLAAIDVVRARNPAIKVLLTTSPVPMTATFSGKDIRIANTYSKSVLRAVCGAVTMRRPLADYFPSYESATLSFPVGVWAPDRIHVTSGFVGKIVAHMLDNYIEGVDEVSRLYQQARTLFLSKDFAAAEVAARAALAVRPDHSEARLVLAEALVRKGAAAEGEAELQALAKLYPDRADILVRLATAIAHAGGRARTSEAMACIEAAVALPSATLSDYRSVMEFLRQRGDPEAAERITRQAIALFPLHVEAYQGLINVLVDQGREAEATELLERAVGLRRAPAAMMIQLAELLIKAGRSAEAEPNLRRALALNPANEAANALLAAAAG